MKLQCGPIIGLIEIMRGKKKDREKKKKKKQQYRNIMSASATHGGHKNY